MLRKGILLPVAIIVMLSLILTGCTPAGPGEEAEEEEVEGSVKFNDENLEDDIRFAIQRPKGAIFPEELQRLTKFNSKHREIADLTGLEHCVNLTYLNLEDNEITDITPLAPLTKLTELDLRGGNAITDISPLAGMTELEWLVVGRLVDDISAVANMTKLRHLIIFGPVTDISALANCKSLEYIDLGACQITDLTPLMNLPNIKRLYLDDNKVEDIKPLVDCPGLGKGDVINLTGCPLNDTSKNVYIPQLKKRGVTVCLDVAASAG